MKVAPDARIQPSPGVLARKVGSELVLLNHDTESYFGLDRVGARMWEAFCEVGSVDGAYQVLLLQFDVDGARLRVDVERLASQLVELGLLQVSST
jgi:hypothetical protein